MRYFLGIIAIFVVSLVQAEPLAPIYFAKNTAYQDVKISPDGLHLAVTVPSSDRSILAILDSKTLDAVSLFQSDANQYIGNFEWVTSKRVVFNHLKKIVGFEQMFSTGHIFGADIDGSRETVIFGYMMQKAQIGTRLNNKSATIRAWGSIAHTLPQDPQNILVEAQYYDSKADAGKKIYKVNFHNGKRWSVTSTPVGKMKIVYDSTGETIFVAGRNRSGDFESHIYKNGEWTQIKSEQKLFNLTPVSVSSDGNTVYLTAYVDHKASGLFSYQISTDQLTLQYQDPIADVYDEIIEPVTERVIGVKTMPGLVNTHYFDEADKYTQLHKTLSSAFAGQDMSITSKTEDGKWLVVLAKNDKNPGDFYLFNVEKMSASYLMSRKEWLDPALMAQREAISFKSKQGHQLHGYITWPQNITKPVPLVTLVHGGPYNVRDTWFFDEEAQLLANNGYAVLQINFRGSSGYGQEFKEVAYKKESTLIQQDIVEATHWAQSQPNIDNKRACIMGASFGGYSAVMAPITEPGLFRCSIAIAGYYDSVQQEKTAYYNDIESIASQTKRMYGDDEAELRAGSALTHIDQFNIPIFIAHGGKDRKVLPEQYLLLKKALDKKNVPIEVYFKETEGHGFYNEQHREELYTKIIAFLAKNIN